MKNIKKSMKPLPPTMRGKKRYVKFELIAEQQLNGKDVSIATIKTLQQLFGEIGLAEKRFKFIGFDEKNNTAIVHCSNESSEEIKAGILFMKNVGNVEVLPHILAVSGSLSKLK